jgi:hypothetical protein
MAETIAQPVHRKSKQRSRVGNGEPDNKEAEAFVDALGQHKPRLAAFSFRLLAWFCAAVIASSAQRYLISTPVLLNLNSYCIK